MILIGLCGPMGSGKSTVATYLAKNHGFREMAFANILKCISLYLFGVLKEDLRGREFLQSLGQGCRDILSTVWIEKLFESIIRDMPGPVIPNGNETYPEQRIVISDVRYLNEARSILEVGGTLIYLHVSDEIRKQRIEHRRGYPISEEDWISMNDHPSEIESWLFRTEFPMHLIDGDRPIAEVNNHIGSTLIKFHNNPVDPAMILSWLYLNCLITHPNVPLKIPPKTLGIRNEEYYLEESEHGSRTIDRKKALQLLTEHLHIDPDVLLKNNLSVYHHHHIGQLQIGKNVLSEEESDVGR